MSAESHAPELLAYIDEREQENLGRVALTTLRPLMPRGDGMGIFEEGKMFSGVEEVGQAEACLTIPASPYTMPQVPTQEFLQGAQRFFHATQLPEGLKSSQCLPEHLILWWKSSESEKDVKQDFIGLSELDPQERAEFCTSISRQASRGVHLLRGFGGKPIIGGGWGNGSVEERSSTGLTRGVPTNGLGHMHILTPRENVSNTVLSDELTPSEKINHYAPWISLVQDKFAHPISSRMEAILKETYQDHNLDFSVGSFKETEVYGNGAIAHQEGYRVSFPNGISMPMVLSGLIDVAGSFEQFYCSMLKAYGNLHKASPITLDSSQAIEEMYQTASAHGFYNEEADELVKFIKKIKPTYGQILNWKSELLASDASNASALIELEQVISKYDQRSCKYLGKNPNSILGALARDTYIHPSNYQEINHTWPAHMSGCFLIEDYEPQLAGGLIVRSVKVFPGIVSNTSVTERLLGTALRRATS
jgi:hypothetical protein